VAAPTALGRGNAVLYLCTTLLDDGRNQEALDVAGDAIADGHRTGIDPSFGRYMDALAAEALTRLGRWTEVDTLLGRHDDDGLLPVGTLRVARAGAMLAARRGDRDRAATLLDRAEAQPSDGWHRTLLDLGAAETHLALGDWKAAHAAAEQGWSQVPPNARLWRARFAHLLTEATVERALDDRAAGGTIDVDAVTGEVEARLAGLDEPGDDKSVDIDARIAHARASLTRLRGPDPDAWTEAARAWGELGDTWWQAVARHREGEAAVATGAAARGADALRAAHQAAIDMGATALVDEVEATARRTRLSLEKPNMVRLSTDTLARIGLTPRETEVLALVTAGHTNRRIGEALFVSEKTASVHVSNILRKMGATSRVDAAAMAQRLHSA
jgi:DNA-binding CsgD family transcriptional regulator